MLERRVSIVGRIERGIKIWGLRCWCWGCDRQLVLEPGGEWRRRRRRRGRRRVGVDSVTRQFFKLGLPVERKGERYSSINLPMDLLTLV